MSEEHHDTKKPTHDSRSEREILELRIDLKLAEAKEALRRENAKHLEDLAKEKHEPKLRRVLGWSSFIIALLIAGHIWEWFGFQDRMKEEASRIIDQKLIDPQLSTTLDEALSKKAAPYIAAEVRPIQTNLSQLSANLETQKVHFAIISEGVLSNEAQLAAKQAAIAQQLIPLSQRLTNLNLAIESATSEEKHLEQEQKLIALMNRAEVFDRDAIAQLTEISRGTDEVAQFAGTVLDKTQKTLLIDQGSESYLAAIEAAGTNMYGGPFAADEQAQRLLGASLDGAINQLSNDRIFVPQLVRIAHNVKSLWTVSRAAKKLREITGIEFYPWDLTPLDDWWTRNSTNYQDWPYAQYDSAFDNLRRCNYSEALTNFQFLLNVDANADKCRAFAIACALETGNFEKAQELNTNYMIKDGRWADWANVKMTLATNVECGTRLIPPLLNKYPAMKDLGFLQAGNHVTRQVDWDLLTRLMQPTNNALAVKTNVTRVASGQ